MRSFAPLVFVIGPLTACQSDYNLYDGIDINPGQVTDCAFTPISGTKISQYDCNPVYPQNAETNVGSIGFHVTEVVGHAFYQMWYGSDNGTVEYAVSNNGTEWEQSGMSPLFGLDAGEWDADAFTNQVVVWDPIDMQYVMSYQGYSLGPTSAAADDSWGIGITTSPDGINWTKHPNNPVIDFTDYTIPEQDYWNYFCTQRASSPSFCDLIGVTYSSFTSPTVKLTPCWPLTMTITNRGNFKGFIGARDSMDVLASFDWEKFESDVLNTGTGTVEQSYYASCHVYSMDAITSDNWVINDKQPILRGEPGTQDAAGVAAAAVVDFDDTLYMFYIGFSQWEADAVNEGLISGSNLSLNIATSTDDGLTWTKDAESPYPVNLTNPGEMSAIGASVVGSRIHFWLTDNYDERYAVGYFYYEPRLEENHP